VCIPLGVDLIADGIPAEARAYTTCTTNSVGVISAFEMGSIGGLEIGSPESVLLLASNNSDLRSLIACYLHLSNTQRTIGHWLRVNFSTNRLSLARHVPATYDPGTSLLHNHFQQSLVCLTPPGLCKMQLAKVSRRNLRRGMLASPEFRPDAEEKVQRFRIPHCYLLERGSRKPSKICCSGSAQRKWQGRKCPVSEEPGTRLDPRGG